MSALSSNALLKRVKMDAPAMTASHVDYWNKQSLIVASAYIAAHRKTFSAKVEKELVGETPTGAYRGLHGPTA